MSDCLSCYHIFWGCILKKVKNHEITYLLQQVHSRNRIGCSHHMPDCHFNVTASQSQELHGQLHRDIWWPRLHDRFYLALACVWKMSSMCNHTPYIYSGPILGSYLYECGGFALPLHVTGVLIIVFTFCLCIVIPLGQRNDRDKTLKENTKALTLWEVMKVKWYLNFLT